MLTLPALHGDKDQSLQAALARWLNEFEVGKQLDDDPHVTAVRRLPPQTAQYAPFPESLDPRLQSALRARGIEQLYTHQAEAIDRKSVV